MKQITVLSGGVDSSTALARMLATGPADPLAIAFDYGQTHRVELEAAKLVAAAMDVPLQIIDVRGLLSGGSLLGEGEVPDGSYASENLSSTVVHARNMLFASIAVGIAGDGGEVWLGVHGGDHDLYPDCRPSFWNPYQVAVAAAYNVGVRVPFLDINKARIIAEAAYQRVPLDLTWSCYKGGSVHCGACGTCVERRESFITAGVPDPTIYADV